MQQKACAVTFKVVKKVGVRRPAGTFLGLLLSRALSAGGQLPYSALPESSHGTQDPQSNRPRGTSSCQGPVRGDAGPPRGEPSQHPECSCLRTQLSHIQDPRPTETAREYTGGVVLVVVCFWPRSEHMEVPGQGVKSNPGCDLGFVTLELATQDPF